MTDLAQRFQVAQNEVVELNEAPDVQTKLKLYAMFKQASEGDVQGERPSAIQFVAQAKYDAWTKLAGQSKEQAMQDYVNLVEQLKANDE
ncbi:acyl-CoA-binding protein [Chitinibacter bivalviorum]|uniref:Acyl-CoA-binding protein n=1 Tax=Chitinibacter bivalviorum TaxID=2739434 RepID=A0A7H9BMH4_9NEIS|nr:acyl-CoA-binding protein [Chitinibacter bivalviorum]QLG88574.1 acyl-CoA-binding protein [Chitinibacter bivalviorum]